MAHESNKNRKLHAIEVADVNLTLETLKRHMDTQDIEPLLSSLEALKSDPQNETSHEQVINAFNELAAARCCINVCSLSQYFCF